MKNKEKKQIDGIIKKYYVTDTDFIVNVIAPRLDFELSEDDVKEIAHDLLLRNIEYVYK